MGKMRERGKRRGWRRRIRRSHAEEPEPPFRSRAPWGPRHRPRPLCFLRSCAKTPSPRAPGTLATVAVGAIPGAPRCRSSEGEEHVGGEEKHRRSPRREARSGRHGLGAPAPQEHRRRRTDLKSRPSVKPPVRGLRRRRCCEDRSRPSQEPELFQTRTATPLFRLLYSTASPPSLLGPSSPSFHSRPKTPRDSRS